MTLDFYPHSPLPAYVDPWETLDADPRTAHLIDQPWRYFAHYLGARGYALCWRYYSRAEPETPFRPHAFRLPVARDPFNPKSGEGFLNYLGGMEGDEDANRRGGIHQTTGWLTPAATLKMAYDAQDRICALKALHSTRSATELSLLTFLNSPKLRTDPANHTIPLLDSGKPLATQEWSFAAMPYWPRSVQVCVMWEVDDYFERLGQALEGLAFMHRHGIVHRDISPTNLLLNLHTPSAARDVYTPLARLRIKLAYIDFGCAARYPADTDPMEWTGTGYVGTGEHVAPEVPRDRKSAKRYRVAPVDVYALGSVFLSALNWEQLHCATFGNPSSLPLAAHQLIVSLPSTQGYLALLTRMTHPDPLQRPSAQFALDTCRALRTGLPARVRWAPEGGYPPSLGDAQP
ncbi:Protein kinase domain-containing protein [Mycena kentingensis (nom. inval.)]|nr:Protein kinase domain-containing protein [Mycena kentingensis (nom. inval.)]